MLLPFAREWVKYEFEVFDLLIDDIGGLARGYDIV